MRSGNANHLPATFDKILALLFFSIPYSIHDALILSALDLTTVKIAGDDYKL
jgi:hypothetical protein